MLLTFVKFSSFLVLLTLLSSASVFASGSEDLVVFDSASSTFMRRSADGSIASTKIDTAKGSVMPVTADYDGDGKIDIGYWSPTDKTWSIIRSSDGQELNIAINDRQLDNGIPVAGQFDQDRRADIAFFLPEKGIWYLLTSLHGYDTSVPTEIKLGSAGDVPVAADYDGDGITDAAIFRSKTNEWIYRSSSTKAELTEKFESKAGDILVPADYTGDGKADLAFYRAETLHGVWFILNSSTHTLEKLVFGFKDALPMPIDIDGDGIIDPTFYEKGTWYFYDSSYPRLHTIKFGSSECLPVVSTARLRTNSEDRRK